jgi:hypothetical protein
MKNRERRGFFFFTEKPTKIKRGTKTVVCPPPRGTLINIE